MHTRLDHDLAVPATRDETARQDFATGMRKYVLGNLAGHMRTIYDRRVKPAYEKARGQTPADGPEIHAAMRGESVFRFYSSIPQRHPGAGVAVRFAAD